MLLCRPQQQVRCHARRRLAVRRAGSSRGHNTHAMMLPRKEGSSVVVLLLFLLVPGKKRKDKRRDRACSRRRRSSSSLIGGTFCRRGVVLLFSTPRISTAMLLVLVSTHPPVRRYPYDSFGTGVQRAAVWTPVCVWLARPASYHTKPAVITGGSVEIMRRNLRGVISRVTRPWDKQIQVVFGFFRGFKKICYHTGGVVFCTISGRGYRILSLEEESSLWLTTAPIAGRIFSYTSHPQPHKMTDLQQYPFLSIAGGTINCTLLIHWSILLSSFSFF